MFLIALQMRNNTLRYPIVQEEPFNSVVYSKYNAEILIIFEGASFFKVLLTLLLWVENLIVFLIFNTVRFSCKVLKQTEKEHSVST